MVRRPTCMRRAAEIKFTCRATVEEANRTQPAFAKVHTARIVVHPRADARLWQIFKEMILVTRPDAELPRVGKGSVSRKAALALYDAEISAL
jgi:hypothetical protein